MEKKQTFSSLLSILPSPYQECRAQGAVHLCTPCGDRKSKAAPLTRAKCTAALALKESQLLGRSGSSHNAPRNEILHFSCVSQQVLKQNLVKSLLKGASQGRMQDPAGRAAIWHFDQAGARARCIQSALLLQSTA